MGSRPQRARALCTAPDLWWGAVIHPGCGPRQSASAPVYVDVLAAPVPPAAAIPIITVSGPATVRSGPRGSRYAIKLASSLPSTTASGRRVGLYVDGVRRATLLTSPTGSTGYYVSFRKGVHKVSAVFFGAPDLVKSVSKDLRVRAS